MPTIDDVAKYAGVSHGTASKVINHVPGVSSKKIELVQKAIEALGYQPSIYARGLKTQKLQQLDLVLPTVQDKALSDLYDSVYWAAKADGYTVNLHISHEMPAEEVAILTEILTSKTSGVILMTCQPHNKALFSSFAQNDIPLIFIQRSAAEGNFDFIDLNIQNILYEHITETIHQGFSDIALITLSPEYSFEQNCRETYLNALLEHNLTLRDAYIVSVNNDSNTSTLEALKLLKTTPPPQVIYTTNALVATGVEYAIELTSADSGSKPLLISLHSSSWEKIPSRQRIELPYTQLGLEAYSQLKNILQQKTAPGTVRISLNPPRVSSPAPCVYTASAQKKELRFLIKAISSNADRSLVLDTCLDRLEQEQGIKVQVDYVRHDIPNELYYDTLLQNGKTDKYDLFTLDIPMLVPLEREGLLLHLDDYPEIKQMALQSIPSNILSAYGIVNKKLVALPFSFTTQLLFYRKDLFGSSKLQRLYLEMFKEKLRPPKSWKEYNQVAKFFTRSYNPDSPTIYGSTFLPTEGMEILPRFWSLSRKKDRFTKKMLDSPAFSETVRYLLELCNYVPDFNPDSKQNIWDSQICTFRQGEIAMSPIYAGQVHDLNYSSNSDLIGKLGYTLLPEKYSIQGGWSCAINSYSKNRETALHTLSWLCSEELLFLNAIGGRFFPHKSMEKNIELYSLFPWYKTMTEAFNYAIPRPFVELSNSSSALPGTVFNEIVSIIRNCHQKKLTLDATLAIIQKSIK